MNRHRGSHTHQGIEEASWEYEADATSQERLVRKKLELCLERKRWHQEIDELDGEFDWDEFNR